MVQLTPLCGASCNTLQLTPWQLLQFAPIYSGRVWMHMAKEDINAALRLRINKKE